MNLLEKKGRELINFFYKLFSSKGKGFNEVIPKAKTIKTGYKRNVLTNREKRDEFLASKGYTFQRRYKPKRPGTARPLSPYYQYIIKFISLKREEKIDIKSYKNKWGFPRYELRKTAAEQVKGI